MGKRSGGPDSWEGGYLRQTRRPLHGLAFILLPLVVFQAYALRYGTALLAPRDLAWLLGYFGATDWLLPPALIVVVLLLQHLAHRHPWRVRPGVLGGMLVESALWVVPLFSLNYLTHRLLLAAGTEAPPAWARPILQAVGAGIYEEFIFRLFFISIVLVILVDLLEVRRNVSVAAALVVGAVLFSLYHLSRAEVTGAAPFPWWPFFFRAVAGVYLGVLYLFRGFGIAVGTHAFWNIAVAWLNSG